MHRYTQWFAMQRSSWALVAVLAICPFPAFGRTEAIVNYESVPVAAGTENPPTPEAVREAITLAGLRQDTPWVVTERAPGRLRLSRLVRAERSAVIDVTYTGRAYSIHYVTSYRMGRRSRDGRELIDSSYNRFVREFKAELDELLRQIPDDKRQAAG